MVYVTDDFRLGPTKLSLSKTEQQENQSNTVAQRMDFSVGLEATANKQFQQTNRINFGLEQSVQQRMRNTS